MLMEQKFVFLSVPGRQVKPSTIIMREKAAMWATQNKKERLSLWMTELEMLEL